MSLKEEPERLDGASCQGEASSTPGSVEAPSLQALPGPDPIDPRGPIGYRRSAQGFGIVELLNGILIIAVLASIVIAVVNDSVRRAREAAAMAYLRSWPLAMESFRLANDRYPSSLEELTQSQYLGRMSIDRVQYTFSLTLKVALVPGSSSRHALSAPPNWWQTVLARWRSSGVAWAAGNGGNKGGNSGSASDSGTTEGDADKGHGNEADGCDEDNPGQGKGGPCNKTGSSSSSSTAGGGWEGWATPVGGKGKHFYIDETGTIRYALNAAAAVSSPPIP